jgi:hypothetical protein
MESVPDLPWGKIAAVSGGLVTAYLAIRGGAALVSLSWREARDRLAMGRLPGRR